MLVSVGAKGREGGEYTAIAVRPGGDSLSDLRLICCASGRSGSYLTAFSLHRTAMRLESGRI